MRVSRHLHEAAEPRALERIVGQEARRVGLVEVFVDDVGFEDGRLRLADVRLDDQDRNLSARRERKEPLRLVLEIDVDAIVGIRGATIGRRAELSPFNETISQQIVQHDERGERDRSAAEVGDRLQPPRVIGARAAAY